MRARLIGVDAPEWSAILAGNPHDIYHLPGYVSRARQETGTPTALFVEDGVNRRLLLPLIIRDVGEGHQDAVTPYGYPGPIADRGDDPQFIAAALTAGIRSLDSEGIVSLFARLHPLIRVDGLDAISTLVNHGETVVIDLSLSEEELWSQTRENHRRDIARSQRSGHRFAFETSTEAFDAFKRVYRATMERRSASDFYLFGDDYFDELRAALRDRLHLAAVRVHGQVAAAGLFTESCGIVQLHLSGSYATYAAARPTKLLYHGVRTWAKRRQFRWFHLGGGLGAQDDTLLHFKSGFSPLRLDYFTMRIVVREQDYRDLVATRGLGAGPSDLTSFFPGYRR